MRNALLFVLMLCEASLCFGAEVYPSQPVRLIVPFGPGGSSDVFGRVISQPLAEQLGKQFIIDNRPGAGGRIGTAVVAKAAPAGYVLLVTDAGLTIYPGLYKSLPFDVLNDFTPITQILRMPNVLVVHPSLNVRTLKEFIALAQANPGKYNSGAAGTGSGAHLATELFKSAAKVNIVNITYAGGGGEVISALLSGQIQMFIITATAAAAYVKSGQLRALAVTTDGRRSSAMPDVPSMSEAGVPDMAVYQWTGLAGPAGMPKEVVNKLYAEVVKAIAVPSVKERLIGLGAELVGSSPDEFSIYIRNEISRWAAVIKSAGIAVE
jgi:tripartite-type tricarboxylate transporter receptor subunit TctC